MKARRAALPASLRAAGAERAAVHVCGLLAASPGATVSGFLSIGEELDTGPLLRRLHAAGHPLCLPVMQGKGKPLVFRAWAPGDDMATVMWGIREPKPERPVMVPDVLIVPLLAFDRRGWRLGYGGGFYDRTIAGLRASGPVVAIGIGFAEQEVDAVPHLAYDERLDRVVTPSGRIDCHD